GEASTRQGQLEAFLPQEASHGDVKRLILDRQLVDKIVVGGVVVYRPPGSRQHEIARLPLEHLAADGRAPGAVEVVIDGGRGVAVRPIDDLGRPYRHRSE